jgi:hypothetical protein
MATRKFRVRMLPIVQIVFHFRQLGHSETLCEACAFPPADDFFCGGLVGKQSPFHKSIK